jgi:hypothetical protein
MNKKGIILLSAWVLIIAVVFLIASAAITNLYLKNQVTRAGEEIQSAAYIPDLDHWFVQRFQDMAREDISDVYSDNVGVRTDRIKKLGGRLSDFAFKDSANYDAPLEANYTRAAFRGLCPTLFDEENFMGMPTIVCNHIYILRDDRNAFEDVEGYSPSFLEELSHELSTFDTRSFAKYDREAFIQNTDGRIIKLEAEVTLTK